MAQKSRKKKSSKKILSLRKVDSKLWKKVQKYAKGKLDKKSRAIEIIFKDQYNLPQTSINLVLNFTKKSQPKKLRLKVANCVKKYDNIPYGMYVSVITELAKDPHEKIRKMITAERVKAGFGLYSLNLAPLSPSLKAITQLSRLPPTITSPTLKSIMEANKAFRTAITPSLKVITQLSRLPPTITSPTLKSIMEANKAFRTAIPSSLTKLQEERRKSIQSIASSLPPKQLVGIATISERINKLVSRNILRPTKSYYSQKELEILKKPVRIPSESRAKSLA
ncbi:MAG: hypothetical protein IIA83_09820, partial [Thaumarchaeota archaeon]|nr:hypothetical protein [Nitrososphaerota archaeon]